MDKKFPCGSEQNPHTPSVKTVIRHVKGKSREVQVKTCTKCGKTLEEKVRGGADAPKN